MTYSLIIPVYNESEAILSTIEQCLTLDGLGELIIVNDGSTDKTLDILNSVKSKKLYVISNRKNMGYGFSLKTGIKQAKNEIIAITDADATYPNQRIPEMVALTAKYDMVVGVRLGKNIGIFSIRRFPKWCLQILANYLAETHVPDLNSGLRVMKKSIVQKFYNILPNGFSFTTTITLAMLTNNFDVHYIPIEYYGRKGRSKIRPLYDSLIFLQLIIRTIVYFRPFKVFFDMALITLAMAFTVLCGGYLFTGKIYAVTTAVLFIAAIQWLSIGLIADLIQKRTHFEE